VVELQRHRECRLARRTGARNVPKRAASG
jgi:hypothetical protein